MGLFDKIFSSTVGKVVDKVGEAFDKNFTSEEERLTKMNEAKQMIRDAFSEIVQIQSRLVKAELSGNWLQRSWRPLVMLAFASIVVYAKFLAPAFGLPNAELEQDFWGLLKIGIGGYVAGRSVEKVADKVDIKGMFKK